MCRSRVWLMQSRVAGLAGGGAERIDLASEPTGDDASRVGFVGAEDAPLTVILSTVLIIRAALRGGQFYPFTKSLAMCVFSPSSSNRRPCCQIAPGSGY